MYKFSPQTSEQYQLQEEWLLEDSLQSFQALEMDYDGRQGPKIPGYQLAYWMGAEQNLEVPILLAKIPESTAFDDTAAWYFGTADTKLTYMLGAMQADYAVAAAEYAAPDISMAINGLLNFIRPNVSVDFLAAQAQRSRLVG